MNQDQVHVILVPFPGQGHLNQLLQLSCLISSYRLPVHYVGSATHNRQARIRANGLRPLDIAKIDFRDLPTPDFASPPPDRNATSKFPGHLRPCWEATKDLRKPVGEVLKEISSRARRIAVIYDPMMAQVIQDAIAIPGAECYSFNCISVFSLFFMLWESLGKPFLIDELPKGLPSLWSVAADIKTDDIKSGAADHKEFLKHSAGNLHNTSRVMEGKFIDLIARVGHMEGEKHWAIGPMIQTTLSSVLECSNRTHKCFEWLNQQAPNSVLYVSFGTTTSISDIEAKEIAKGLEESEQNFIWVLRDADKGDVFDEKVRRIELPEGFEERMEGKGLIIRDWAPQPEILAHPSTGGFMSHCGWNSCTESISTGVPIAAWPMHSDQPWNAVLVTEVLKIGLIVKEWERRGELVSSSDISPAVKRLMASEEGVEIRKRAKELGDAVRKSTEEGGHSRKELDSFIARITR